MTRSHAAYGSVSRERGPQRRGAGAASEEAEAGAIVSRLLTPPEARTTGVRPGPVAQVVRAHA
jgi:hypothetical protein